MMKYKITIALTHLPILIIAALAVVTGTTCAGRQPIDGKLGGPVDRIVEQDGIFTDGRGVEIYTGFIGDDAYRTIGCASPRAGMKDREERMKLARENACLCARRMIAEAFSLRSISRGGYLNFDGENDTMAAYLEKVIRSGRVITTSFSGDDRCCVVYQIESAAEG
jgi:hypothetical protein